MSRIRNLWSPAVLTESGWLGNVRIDVDDAGSISALVPDTASADLPHGSECLRGALLPGIPNLHSHAHQRAMAGLGERATGDGDSFWTWRTTMYRMLSRIEPDQLHAIARLLYMEMLEAGYTHVAEFQYLHHDRAGQPYANRAEMTLQCARAADEVGIGFTAMPVLYRYGGFGAAPAGGEQKRFLNDADGFLSIVSSLAESLVPGQLLGVAPHSLRAVDRSLLQSVLDAAPADCPVHIHIAEQVREVDDCAAWSGLRPVAWLYAHFAPDARWCLVHATHVDGSEVRAVAESGAVVGLCPTTEANLGDGLFPAGEFLVRGGTIGIGSDSQISVSPVEELRWLEYGQRLQGLARNCLADAAADGHTGESLLRRAAEGGARACGINGGAIAVGQRADMVEIDTDHPRLHARAGGSLADSWVFSGNEPMVRSVYAGGRRVVEDGRHPRRESIINEFRRTIDQLST